MPERRAGSQGGDPRWVLDAARSCPKCPSPLLVGGTHDRLFWVCPGCHMAFLSPALMGHAEAAEAGRP